MTNRRQCLSMLAAGAALGWNAPALAQPEYPSRPVRLIVPLPPGSPPDVLARLVGERLQQQWKQPVIVENKPGATGMIGMDQVAKAPPDGYTAGVLFMTHTVLPELFGKVPYDTARDLTPLANLVWIYNVLAVPAQSPLKSVRDLVAQAHSAPGKLTYGSGGLGSPAHLLGESFGQISKTQMLHVPFKGPSEAIQSLLGQQVDLMFATNSVAVPMVRSGKLRALAVTSPTRLPALPEIPTMAEAGVSGFGIREWEGLVMPRGVPAPIVDKWSRALADIVAQPDFKDRLTELGMTAADANSPQSFGQLIQSELNYWAKVVKTAGLKAS
ncbi:MAG: tripartite tricarboxylate transporter substrate binding protein [Ottowia sp.]|uniref:Bug family tripartite tricarboxylate transporter substrate binding protein n=1 Tax=unclassified Ottowia TaxID=2645081 RepID=UPI003C2F5B64